MATITTRVDDNIKTDFLMFCDKLGITPSSLINMFAKACIREQRIPFETNILNYEARRSAEIFKEVNKKLGHLKNAISEDDLINEIMNDRRKKFGYGAADSIA